LTGDERKNLLILRTDRIGDVVLTTPMARAIKRTYPSWRVTFLVDEELQPLVRCCPEIDDVVSISRERGGGRGSGSLLSLVREIRGKRFDIAVLVSPTFRNALVTVLAGIPVRIGTRYRFWSLFFNRRVPLHRLPSEKHELEYNFDLLEPIGVVQEGEEPFLMVPDDSVAKIKTILNEKGESTERGELVAVHPGSGGSSASWPPDKYSSLIDLLEEIHGLRVIVTGSREESSLIDDISGSITSKPLRLDGCLTLVELASLYRECRIVVSNSTGPLHVSMAVGTPVVGLYCRLETCRPTRWGPYGKTPHEVLTPAEEVCSPCLDGKGTGECMKNIAASDVMSSVLRLLKDRAERKQ
jgi:heptosyltransferase-2